jgi:hypothetical protein
VIYKLTKTHNYVNYVSIFCSCLVLMKGGKTCQERSLVVSINEGAVCESVTNVKQLIASVKMAIHRSIYCKNLILC